MAQQLPEGTVTVLFADVAGSTALTNRAGDAAARELLRAANELVCERIGKHRGQEVKGLGDGVMAAFTSARRAVACSVDIQRAFAYQNRREPRRAIHVRIGLNTGEVVREEEDIFGAAVNAAARIQHQAEPGQILVSEGVRIVLGPASNVELRDRGEFTLKGFPQPWRLHEVRWEDDAADGGAIPDLTPYVGRERERSQIRRLIDEAVAGHGGLVLIGGEPGVGKTRLAQELAAEAEERGFTVRTGRCYETEGAPPYIPFIEMLEAGLRLVPHDQFRAALGESAAEVARIMPELRRIFDDILPPLTLPPEHERRFLFNSLREFIERASRTNPLLLVVDDLHWADEATLLFIEHVAQTLHEMPVLVIGTYRDVDLDVGRPLARTLDNLLRARLAQRLTLNRLPQTEVETMLRLLSGHEPPPKLTDVIYGETEGNPFFIEEVVRHLAEEGRLLDEAGAWRPDLEISEFDVPEGVRLVIGRRLARLSADARRVLGDAAIIGRAFTLELLEALVDIGAEALLDAVDEAERAKLVVSDRAAREARFTFAHELIRQTLVSGLSLPRRQRLHLRVAQAMEQVYAASLEEHATDLAHHLFQAGSAADSEKTTYYLTLAGDRAQAAGAFEEALRHFENGLSLQSAGELRGRADLLVKRGMALRSQGRWEDSLADWREALSAYEELPDGRAAGALAAEMTIQLLWGARFPEGIEVSSRGLIALGEVVNADRCRLLAHGGVVRSISGEYLAGEGMINQARLIAQDLGDRRLLGDVLTYRAMHLWSHWQFAEALDAGLKAANLLREAEAPWQLADALWVAQFCARDMGDFERVHEVGKEVEPLADRIGHLSAAIIARTSRNVRELTLAADIDRFQSWLQDDLELVRSTGFGWVSQWVSALAFVHLWKGRWAEALEDAEEAARLAPLDYMTGLDWGTLFLVRAYIGDHVMTRAMFAEKRSELPRPGVANSYGRWTMLLLVVEGLAVIGDRDEAADLLPLVSEAIHTGRLFTPISYRLVHTVAGIAAAAGSQWDTAEEHYETALRQTDELPFVIEQPEVRRWYASMLIDRNGRGDRDKAFRLLTEAVEMYRKIGMPKHVEMAEALLRDVR